MDAFFDRDLGLAADEWARAHAKQLWFGRRCVVAAGCLQTQPCRTVLV